LTGSCSDPSRRVVTTPRLPPLGEDCVCGTGDAAASMTRTSATVQKNAGTVVTARKDQTTCRRGPNAHFKSLLSLGAAPSRRTT
jgi:glycerate-2-kinase